MLIHSIVDSSEVNGPGNRTVVWLQGCDLGCPGCWNADTHAFTGPFTSCLDLVDRILKVPGTEGVTFSGGEPLQQLDEGLDMCIKYLKACRPDFSIGLYTGYSPQELEAGKYRWVIHPRLNNVPNYKKAEKWNWLKTKLDFAVMGRFNQSQVDNSRPLCSSRNQELVLFSNRYTLSDFRPQESEFIITSDMITITGFPLGAL